MENLIYEDDPSPGPGASWVCLCSIQLILPGLAIIALFIILMYSFNWGDWLFDQEFVITTIFNHELTSPIIIDHELVIPIIFSLALVFVWMLWPRKYQILDDSIKVCLQGPFHFDIPFDDIDRAGEGEEPGFWFHIGLNYITAIGQNNICIVRDPKMTVNITPEHPKLFLENLKKAMDEWKRKNPDLKEEPLYSDEEELE